MNESSDSPYAPPSPAPHSLSPPASAAATPVSSSTSTAIGATLSGASTHIEPCPAVIQKKGDGAHLNSGSEGFTHGNKSHILHSNQVECNGSSSAAQIHHQGHVQGQGQRDGGNNKRVDQLDQLNDDNNLDSHHSNTRSDKHGSSSNHNNYSNSNNNHNKGFNHNITINNVNTSRHKSNEISSTSTSHSSSSTTSSSSRAENLIITLHRLSFYLSSKTALKPFAFHYQKQFKHDGWQYCDLMAEYKRQGLLSLPEWKVRISFSFQTKCFFCNLLFVG